MSYCSNVPVQLDVTDLSLHDEYKVRVMCSMRSIVDSRKILVGTWGQEQRFVLSREFTDPFRHRLNDIPRIPDQCTYQSSICSPNSKCMRLKDVGPVRLGSYPKGLFLATAVCCDDSHMLRIRTCC